MFELAYRDNYGTEAYVDVPCTASVAYKPGIVLTEKGAIATGTTVPSYICVQTKTGVSGETVRGYRILKDMVFKTTVSASATSLVPGDKVTLHASNGEQVTATTTSGIAEIIKLNGTASGSEVLVRF